MFRLVYEYYESKTDQHHNRFTAVLCAEIYAMGATQWRVLCGKLTCGSVNRS